MSKLTDYYAQVREFHTAYNVPILDTPRFPNLARVELRESLIREEVTELFAAIIQRDLVGVADGIADAIVVLIGTALEFGIPLDKVMAEVHRSNMSKLGPDGKPVLRSDGKVLKGPNFTPPDIRSILIEAKWDAEN